VIWKKIYVPNKKNILLVIYLKKILFIITNNHLTEAFYTKITYFNSVSNRYLLKINRINITDLKKLIANHFSIIKAIDKLYDIPQSNRTTGSPKASSQELSEIKKMRANITANIKHFEDALVYKTKIEQTQKKLVEKNVREIMTSISEQLRKLIVNPVDWGNLDWHQRFKQIETVVNDNKFVEIPDNVKLLLK
jgi:hypothetical protein